jgi:uncharacterized Fe-S cluster protein YjdI
MWKRIECWAERIAMAFFVRNSLDIFGVHGVSFQYLSTMERNIKKHYSSGEVTIVWQNALCIHSGNCVRGLSSVFNSRQSPWINAGGASTVAIIEQVKKCPSGALSFFMNAENPGDTGDSKD